MWALKISRVKLQISKLSLMNFQLFFLSKKNDKLRVSEIFGVVIIDQS